MYDIFLHFLLKNAIQLICGNGQTTNSTNRLLQMKLMYTIYIKPLSI